MTHETTALKTWQNGEYTISKIRDEDGDIEYLVTLPDGDTEGFADLESAREWITYDRNGNTLNEIENLLCGIDLSEKATTRKFAAVLAYLRK